MRGRWGCSEGPVPGLPQGLGAVGHQTVDAPCSLAMPGPHVPGHARASQSWVPGLGAAWLPTLGPSSLCLGRSPASCPLHLPMEPDAALGKTPSGVCCLSPPS